MHKSTLAALAIALVCLPARAHAEEEHRQLGPHVHGHGALNIAIDGNKLEMELNVPGMDIVGFEHQAGTPEQQGLVDTARKDLGEGILNLLVLPQRAGCALVSNSVAVVAEEHHGEDEQHEVAEEEGEHDDNHRAFHATYELTCTAPEQLTGIDFRFFERFPGSQELDVTVIDDQGQRAYEVKREVPVLELTR